MGSLHYCIVILTYLVSYLLMNNIGFFSGGIAYDDTKIALLSIIHVKITSSTAIGS